MASKYQHKRFQRSLGPYNNSSLQIAHSNSFLALKQASGLYQNLDKNMNPLNNDKLHLMLKLFEIESLLEDEREQRITFQNKIMKSLKQMQCKHSSIIYNSEIRYCKSPPKPEIFFNVNRNLPFDLKGDKQNKGLSKMNVMPQEKQNMVNQLSLKPNKGEISDCGSVENRAERDGSSRINIQLFRQQQNPEKMKEQTKKFKQSSILAVIQQQISKLPWLIEKKVEEIFSSKTEVLQRRLINTQDVIKALQIDIQTVLNQQSNISQKAQIYMRIDQQKCSELATFKQQCLDTISGNQQLVNQFKTEFNNSIRKLSDQIQSQRAQIKQAQKTSQFNSNIYSRQIMQIEQFLKEKIRAFQIETMEKQKVRGSWAKNMEEKIMKGKQIEQQKQRERREMVNRWEESVHKNWEVMRQRLWRQLKKECGMIEEGVIGAIQRHIEFVQKYIRQNSENQEKIMQKYREIDCNSFGSQR